jgi:hypothetical protein
LPHNDLAVNGTKKQVVDAIHGTTAEVKNMTGGWIGETKFFANFAVSIGGIAPSPLPAHIGFVLRITFAPIADGEPGRRLPPR